MKRLSLVLAACTLLLALNACTTSSPTVNINIDADSLINSGPCEIKGVTLLARSKEDCVKAGGKVGAPKSKIVTKK